MLESITALIPWIQYPATALTVIGFYFLGSTHAKMRQIGFIMNLVGNIVWITYGTLPLQIGLIATNVCIFILAVRGYLNNRYGIDAKLLKYMREIGLLNHKEKENL